MWHIGSGLAPSVLLAPSDVITHLYTPHQTCDTHSLKKAEHYGEYVINRLERASCSPGLEDVVWVAKRDPFLIDEVTLKRPRMQGA